MVDQVKLAATAKRLVEANGRPVDLFKVNSTPSNPVQPWRGVSGSPTVPEGGVLESGVIVCFVPAGGAGLGKVVRDLTGELHTAFEQVGLLAATSLADPDTGEQFDSIRDGTDIWKMVLRGRLKPGTTSMLYLVGLER